MLFHPFPFGGLYAMMVMFSGWTHFKIHSSSLGEPSCLCNLGLSGALLTELENNYFIPVPNTTLCNRGMFSFSSPSGTPRSGYLTPCSLSLFFHSTFQAQGKCSCPPEKEGKLEVWGHLMLIFPRLSHGAHRVSGASSRAPITPWTPNQSPPGCIVPCPPSP